MKSISDTMFNILEKLAEMFPKQHYQSELEKYIASRGPKNSADIEIYCREYQEKSRQAWL